jgi:hypothetical protein
MGDDRWILALQPWSRDGQGFTLGEVRGTPPVVIWRSALELELPERSFKWARIEEIRALTSETLLVRSAYTYHGGAGAGHIGAVYDVLDVVELSDRSARSILRALAGESAFGTEVEDPDEEAGRQQALQKTSFTLRGIGATTPARRPNVSLIDESGTTVAEATWSADLSRYEPWFLGP